MRFPYLKLTKKIWRPTIPLKVLNGRKFIPVTALIDSGADDCIFRAEVGEAIGLDVRSGNVVPFRGVTSGGGKKYYHDVLLEVGGH